jgi:hypothetical protein
MTLDELVERYAKHCEQEAFTLEALAKERHRLAADMRFTASRTAANKIAEGLRDAIAFAKGGSPNSGGGDAVCDDCGNRHDPYIRCPNYHAGMMPSVHPNPSEKE